MQEQFGRYILLDRIAIGGMAEIFRAKAPGLGGFEKILAIKRLHPRYSQDADFIEMLIDEARITVELSHGNIGQIFDLDKVEDHYYIAMEFIDGRDLYRVLKRIRELRSPFPADGAAYVARGACAGLDYAHRKKDRRGRPLHIVHRDVSPQNVLVSFEGEIKIVDFGIAKAALRAYETEAGIIKGKFYYMSPEQARGEPLDHRTDIFSLGIVLYEMLTGELLYKDEDDATLLGRVRRADIRPPSDLRGDIPPGLERIVMRALARDRSDRFPSAQHMQRDLERFLRTRTSTFGQGDLARLMRELFAHDRPHLGGLDSIQQRSAIMHDGSPAFDVADFDSDDDLTVQESSEHSGDGFSLMPLDSDLLESVDESDAGDHNSGPVDWTMVSVDDSDADFMEEAPTEAYEPPARRSRTPAPVVHRPVPVVAQPVRRSVSRPQSHAVSSPKPVRSTGPPLRSAGMSPPTSEQTLDEMTFNRQPTIVVEDDPPATPIRPIRRNFRDTPAASTIAAEHAPSDGLRDKLVLGGVLLLVAVFAMSLTAVIADSSDDDVPDGELIGLSIASNAPAQATPTGTATLHISSKPSGAAVAIDEVWGIEQTPTAREVAAGRPVSVKIRLRNYDVYETQITLKPGEMKKIDGALKQLTGTLTVNSKPSGAMLSVGGEEKGLTPITLTGISLDQNTRMRLQKDGYEAVDDSVTWSSGQREQTLERRLRPLRIDPPVAKTARRRTRTKTKTRAKPPQDRSGRDTRNQSRRNRSRSRQGYLTVDARPWASVHLNRRKIADETPLLKYRLSPGRYKIYVCYRGRSNDCSPTKRAVIRPGGKEVLRFKR